MATSSLKYALCDFKTTEAPVNNLCAASVPKGLSWIDHLVTNVSNTDSHLILEDLVKPCSLHKGINKTAKESIDAFRLNLIMIKLTHFQIKKITEILENQLFLMLKITENPLMTGTLSALTLRSGKYYRGIK